MNINKLEFSVLMSLYKNDNPIYLTQAIESILNQTIKPNEVVIVVDGPVSKELYSVLSKYSNNEIPFVVHQLNENKGLGIALQEGMGIVKYPLVARMDSDDISVSNRFELQLAAFISNPDLDLVGGQIDEFMQSLDNIVGKRIVPEDIESISKFGKMRNPFNHPTVMFKQESVLKVGSYQNYDRLEDYHLWVRMIVAKMNMLNLSVVLVHMRVNEDFFLRRGGLLKLEAFLRLRRDFYNWNFISKSSEIKGDFILIINAIIPNKIRSYVYSKLLRK